MRVHAARLLALGGAVAVLANLSCVTRVTTTSGATIQSSVYTVVFTPGQANQLDTLSGVLRNRLQQIGQPYRVLQVDGALRVVVGPTTAVPAAVAYLSSAGTLLFRPVWCTAGTGASNELVPFPPYMAGQGPSASVSQADCQLATTAAGAQVPTTSPADDDPSHPVLLPVDNGEAEPDASGPRFLLGPAQLTGQVIARATANPPSTASPTWYVKVDFTAAGAGAFDNLAQANYEGFVAIESNGLVESTPQIQATSFNGSATINGANFTQAQVQGLAAALQSGALPAGTTAGSLAQTVAAGQSPPSAYRTGDTGAVVTIATADQSSTAARLLARLTRLNGDGYNLEVEQAGVVATVVGPSLSDAAVEKALGLASGSSGVSVQPVTVVASGG